MEQIKLVEDPKSTEYLGWHKRFSWIPFYEEMANKLLDYKDNRKELVNMVYETGEAKYIKSEDKGHVSDIDPFTVFGLFNRGLTIEKRKKLAQYFKDKLTIEAELPSDFDGIPILNNKSSTFYYNEEIDIAIQPLWDLFVSVIKKDKEAVEQSFNKVIKQKGIRWNITMGLFWIRPSEYIALEANNRDYLKTLGMDVFNEKQLNAANYWALLEQVKQGIAENRFEEKSIVEISFNARVAKEMCRYWFVGHSYGGNNSQLDRFQKDGVWDGHFSKETKIDQSQLKLIKRVKNGDVLIVKSTSTKGKNHDKSFLRVKAVGVVCGEMEIIDEGTSIKCCCNVKYIPIEEKDFDDKHLGSYLKTIHEVDPKKNKIIEEIISYVDSVLKNNANPQDKPNMQNKKYQKYIDLLKANHNIVLTGAPGTGKTYMAQSIAEEMGCNEEERQFVQFHPSYDYTDFVEGLRPKDEGNGQIGFERKDGVFKEFCRAALQNIKDSKKSAEELGVEKKVEQKDFVFIIDEINRGEASKIFGELFYAIDPGYRGNTKIKVQTQYQNLIEESNVFAKGFYVPENVYIIGTMNDIDRSVESMDFAMRRRFTWIEVKPEENESMLDVLETTLAAEAKNRMHNLNKAITETEGLGNAYQLGAAYFKKLSNNNGDFNALWNMNIEPLLREYLRGSRDADNKLEKLATAYNNQNEKVEEKADNGDTFGE